MNEASLALVIACRGVAMAMAAVSVALMALDLESTAIITSAVGLFALTVVGFIAADR